MTLRAKADFHPLYRRGDAFKIVKINSDPDRMPIEALHLWSKQVYGFEEGELEEGGRLA
jgi:hypothetical protein